MRLLARLLATPVLGQSKSRVGNTCKAADMSSSASRTKQARVLSVHCHAASHCGHDRYDARQERIVVRFMPAFCNNGKAYVFHIARQYVGTPQTLRPQQRRGDPPPGWLLTGGFGNACWTATQVSSAPVLEAVAASCAMRREQARSKAGNSYFCTLLSRFTSQLVAVVFTPMPAAHSRILCSSRQLVLVGARLHGVSSL